MQKAKLQVILFLLCVFFGFLGFAKISFAQKATVGAYYFEGWTTPGHPYHLTTRLMNNFTERMPLWGWHDDTVEIMEQQINLAANHGISFFAFDWYWKDDGGPINAPAIESEPINQGLQLYLQASNKDRLKFCLMIANHRGFTITGTSAWKQGADYWMKYFKDPQYLKVEGKPLLMIFSPSAGDAAAFQYLQQLAQENGLPGIVLVDLGFLTYETSPLYNYYQVTGYYNNAPGWKKGSVAKDYTTLAPKLGKSGDLRPTIPLVYSGVDYRPWHDDSWYYSINHTAQIFTNKLQQVITWMDNNPERVTAERIFMIFAWNEIGEGGYLMPTLGDPDGEWLDAVKSVVLGGSSDITAPSIPTNISAIAVSSSQINLSWTASTDDVGVTGYRVESCSGSLCTNFDQIGTPTGTTFSYTSLSANTSYRYRIRATDAAGNFSGYSAIASATTQIDIGPVGY